MRESRHSYRKWITTSQTTLEGVYQEWIRPRGLNYHQGWWTRTRETAYGADAGKVASVYIYFEWVKCVTHLRKWTYTKELGEPLRNYRLISDKLTIVRCDLL